MNKKDIKTNTLDQLEDMVLNHVKELGTIMDDYDGGQKAAYDKVLKDIRVFEAVISHASDLA